MADIDSGGNRVGDPSAGPGNFGGGGGSIGGPGAGRSGNTPGQAAPGQQVPTGSRPYTIDPITGLPSAAPIAPNTPSPFLTGGGFNLTSRLPGQGGGMVGQAGQPGPVQVDPATGLPLAKVPDATGTTGLRGPTGPLDPNDPNSPQLSGVSTSTLGVGGPFQGASSNYDNRSGLHRILNAIAPFGFGDAKPSPSQPASYAGGDYHLGLNPAAALGSLASLATGFPMIGAALGEGYSLLGGRDLILGGPGAASIPGVTPGVGPPSSGSSAPSSSPARSGGGGLLPISTPTAAQPAASAAPPAAQPVGTPAAKNSTNLSGGQVGGNTIITGSSTVAWPWATANGIA